LVQLSNEIHLLFANLQISAWFEGVPTECNIADIPSRTQGPQEYEFYDRTVVKDVFYDRESLKHARDMVFPSADNVESHDLDLLKWRPSENSR
jgi:hypothetical protein